MIEWDRKKSFERNELSASTFWHRSYKAGLFIPLALLSSIGTVSAWGQSNDFVPTYALTAAVSVSTREIDSLLTKTFKPGKPGVTVIVSRHDVILFRKSYGLANAETNEPLRPELPLRTGSLTKQFTAAAIMLLSEQGKLSLTDEIGKYFPDYPQHSRHVNIEHLLTHTSGIKNYTELPNFGTVLTKDVSVNDAIAFFKDFPPQFQPGSRFSYSNSNYFLLGSIIEKVSGISYSDFMRQQIFQPLGMRSTEIETASSLNATAVGYTQSRKGVTAVPYYSMSWPFAAGALRTSVDDLVIWNSAIRTGSLIKRESWDRMATDYTLTSGKHSGYGYGWFIRRLAGSIALEHGGDIGGFSADTWSFPKEAIFVAVLSNSDSHEPAPDAIAEKIATIILRN